MTVLTYRPTGTRWLRTDVRYMRRRELFRSSGEFTIAGVVCAALGALVATLGDRFGDAASGGTLMAAALFGLFVFSGMAILGAVYLLIRALMRSPSYDPDAVWQADLVQRSMDLGDVEMPAGGDTGFRAIPGAGPVMPLRSMRLFGPRGLVVLGTTVVLLLGMMTSVAHIVVTSTCDPNDSPMREDVLRVIGLVGRSLWVGLLPLGLGLVVGLLWEKNRRADAVDVERAREAGQLVTSYERESWGDIGPRRVRLFLATALAFTALGGLVGLFWTLRFMGDPQNYPLSSPLERVAIGAMYFMLFATPPLMLGLAAGGFWFRAAEQDGNGAVAT